MAYGMFLRADGSLEVRSRYEDREIVKASGARWNSAEKCWVVALTAESLIYLAENLDYLYITDDIQEQFEQQVEREEKLKRIRDLAKTDERIRFKVPGINLSLYNYQKLGVQFAVTNGDGVLIADEMGLGKAGAIDSLILTPHGFIRMGDVQVGDNVIGKNGKEVKVKGVFPQGIKKIYRVTFSDNASTECCGDHLWGVNTSVRKNRGVSSMVKSINELLEEGLTRKNGKNGERWNWYIPMVEPVQFEKSITEIDPYVLGCLIGDGCFCHSLTFSSADDELIRDIESRLPSGICVKKAKKMGFRIVGKKRDDGWSMIDKLRSLGLWGVKSADKFIPMLYKVNSVDARLEMLRGLMDTDGTVQRGKRGNSALFCTVSTKLRDDVVWICRSLGGTARYGRKKAWYRDKNGRKIDCKDAWIITVSLPSGMSPFRLSRKAKIYPNDRVKYNPSRAMISIECIGEKEAQCISVDAGDGLYVADDFIVTHNTAQGIASACFKKYKEGIQHCLVIAPASVKWNWPIEISKFSDEEYVVIDGSPKARVGQWLRNDVFFYVVNFELVLEDLFGGRSFKIKEDDTDLTIDRKMRQMEKSEARAEQLASVRERIWDCLIVDECFHPDAQIEMSDGSQCSISSVVCSKESVEVLSYNVKTDKIEPKKVIGWFKNSIRQCYRVCIDGGISYPTENHKYMTQEGYKRIGDLRIGDEVLFRDKLGISDRQLSVLAGTMLGDSSLQLARANCCSKRARLEWTYGTCQAEYLDWKTGLFRDMFSVNTYDNGGHGSKSSVAVSMSIFTETDYFRFYQADGKKKVTREWLELIDELGLAVWYMDSGYDNATDSSYEEKSERANYATFHTEAFSHAENILISDWLLSRWGISNSLCTYQKEGKEYHIIRLDKDGSRNLLHTIGRYVPPCMQYKLGAFECNYDFCANNDDFIVGERMRISRIHHIEPHKKPCVTYNIEVEDNGNYFVGSALVSNCHFLKAHNSKRSKNVKQLKAKFRIALTGTPLDGRLEELHSVMDFVRPGLFESKTRFMQKHAEFDFWGRVTRYRKVGEVRERMQPFFIRRLKKDVLKELPDKVYENRYVILSAEEKKIYRQLATKGHEVTEDTEAVVAVIRCKQFCDCPELLDIATKKKSKFDAFLEILEEVVIQNGNKALIFSQYAMMNEVLVAELERLKLGYRYIWSETPKRTRVDIQEEFSSDPSINVVIGTDAMALGLNFTAASYVINYDDAWSPSVMSQREDRCLEENQLVFCPRSGNNGCMSIKAIKDVEVGDKVLTHTGKESEVVGKKRTTNVDGRMTRIIYTGWPEPIECTFDHKWLIRRKDTGVVEWALAHTILTGDNLLLSRPVLEERLDVVKVKPFWRQKELSEVCVSLPDIIEIDDEWLFVFGRFAATGVASISDNKADFVSLSGHESVLERCGRVFSRLGINSTIHKIKNSKIIEFRAYSSELAHWFRDWFGHGAANKRLPRELELLPKDQARVVLDSDGHSDGLVEWVSASREMTYQFCMLAVRCGFSPTLRQGSEKSGSHWIGGFALSSESNDAYVEREVRSVESYYEKHPKVYDISVEPDNSFVVGFATAHNCHRVGQEGTVTVINFVVRDTIEERIREVLYAKSVITAEVLGDETDEMIMKRLGPKDIAKLL